MQWGAKSLAADRAGRRGKRFRAQNPFACQRRQYLGHRAVTPDCLHKPLQWLTGNPIYGIYEAAGPLYNASARRSGHTVGADAMSQSLLGSATSNPLSGQATGLSGPYPPSLLGSGTSGNALSGLFANSGSAPTQLPTVTQWQYVRRRFARLLDNITISPTQREDGERKQAGVRACLNRHYWGTASETGNSMLIGSWGKNTRGHPSRDVDVLFLLPPEVYYRFQERAGNRQSQLLQEVKNVLSYTYSQTTMRGDGQVVSIPFNTIPIEAASDVGLLQTRRQRSCQDANRAEFAPIAPGSASPASRLAPPGRRSWASAARADGKRLGRSSRSAPSPTRGPDCRTPTRTESG
jgi:hypothetical protein